MHGCATRFNHIELRSTHTCWQDRQKPDITSPREFVLVLFVDIMMHKQKASHYDGA